MSQNQERTDPKRIFGRNQHPPSTRRDASRARHHVVLSITMDTRPMLVTTVVTLALVVFVTALTTTEESSTTTIKFPSTEKVDEKEPITKTTTTTTELPTTTATPPPPTTTEWEDMNDEESQKLVDFVVAEIQKLKVEHKELDGCQELNLSTVLSGKKMTGKITKYTVTLKVQPQMKNIDACLQQNSTNTNMHPEICEADVTDDDRGGTEGKTLLRSTCLQVEELQD